MFQDSQQVPQSVDSTKSCSLVWFGFWFFETVSLFSLLSWNSICGPGWPQTWLRDPPASAS